MTMKRLSWALLVTTALLSPAALQARTPDEAPKTDQEGIHEDERGRYRIRVYPKTTEGVGHVRLPDGRLQVTYGLAYEILEESEEAFLLRVPVRDPEPEASPAPQAAEKPPAEPAAAPPPRPVLAQADRLRLTSFGSGLPEHGQWRHGFAVGDLDADGHLDLAFGPVRKGSDRPILFRGNGAGEWERWRLGLPHFGYDYGDVAVADFNRDGHLDLALASHLQGLWVLVGDGEGHFESWSRPDEIQQLPSADGGTTLFSSRALEAVDWDDDGWTDLVALAEASMRVDAGGMSGPTETGLVLFRNQGDSHWTPIQGPSKAMGDSLAVGDFDGDGKPDVATASQAVGMHAIVHWHDGESPWRLDDLPGLPAHSFVFAVGTGDLDRDGRDDLLVGWVGRQAGVWLSAVDAYYRDGDGWSPQPLWSTPGRAGIYSLASGDLDGDGRRDVAIGSGNGEVVLLLGDGARGFVRDLSPELGEPTQNCKVYGLGFADLDGEGGDELVVTYAGERVGIDRLRTAPGCAREGSVSAWKAAPIPPTAGDD